MIRKRMIHCVRLLLLNDSSSIETAVELSLGQLSSLILIIQKRERKDVRERGRESYEGVKQ